jgi:hypothetical protein
MYLTEVSSWEACGEENYALNSARSLAGIFLEKVKWGSVCHVLTQLIGWYSVAVP